MIRLTDIAWHASGFRLEGVSFTVPEGKYAVLMGRTGCGKSTLLEIISGLRQPERGRVEIGGRDVTDESPARRGLGYVPQDGALFPAMKVGAQIPFALRMRGRSRDEQRQVSHTLAAAMSVTHLLERLPADLSGGEKQRVAMARALAAQPRVLLLDEPLAALDEDTRGEMMALLQNLHRTHGLTVLHVTHQRSEAAVLAEITLRLEGGKVVEESRSDRGRTFGDPDLRKME